MVKAEEEMDKSANIYLSLLSVSTVRRCQKDAKGPTPNNLQRSLLLRTKPKMYNYKRLTKTASQLLPKPPNYYLRLRPTHGAASDKYKHKKCANTKAAYFHPPL